MTLSPVVLSSTILGLSLLLFLSERVRHDVIAVLALSAAVITGLVRPQDAFSGFSDPAVATVAAVLVVGRTLELTGLANQWVRRLAGIKAPYSAQMFILMTAGALLSAFINNIAALVIVMPLAAELARNNKKSPGTILMPLAFATILGGMTTLIGTPANMILSSIREEHLGNGFRFFAMAPLGLSVAILGLIYLAVIGWRLLPVRRASLSASSSPWKVFELQLTRSLILPQAALTKTLRRMRVRFLRLVRRDHPLSWPQGDRLKRGDRLLVMSRSLPFELSNVSELPVARYKREPGAVAARVVIANGSPLIGQAQAALAASSSGAVTCIGMGPRGAKERLPLSNLRLQSGDQLFLDGLPDDIATFATKNRLLEIDRADTAPVDARKSILALSFFLLALSAILLWRLPPALPFLLAATAMAGFKLIPSREVYTSVDWSIIVLLAAMIPVGQSFESTGAAAKVAEFLAGWLVGSPLYLIIAAISGLTLILTILLNNVATALVMGPLSIQLAETLHVPVDALLLAVLVGASADFLTPIGHQNNLLVMRPGGYKFTDYARAGFLLSVVVIVVTTGYLSIVYGQSR